MKFINPNILVSVGLHLKNTEHPFEREIKGIESFEEWEYRKAKVTLSYFSTFFDLNRLFKGKKVLDIGCGGGGKTAYIAKYYEPKQIYGVDLSEDFISKAKGFGKSLNIKEMDFLVCNAENLPFKDSEFDSIILFDTFEHLKNPIKVLNEAKRVLKVGGYILISFPPYYHPYGAHVNDLIPIPWVHLFFDNSALAKAYWTLSFYKEDGERRRKLKITKGINGSLEIGYINQMTLKKCKEIIKSIDLKVKYFKYIPLKDFLYPFINVKMINELIVKNCVIVLERGH
ncbi:MAG TPA: class I SAM-dependent methyltransferase [Caldisericia bacterium]|nr:class I SAM-dependent methyltransferase [Caldisericia bacterium]